jgi:apolipoprotein N-acyltransferase
LTTEYRPAPRWQLLAGLTASALLLGLYARVGAAWPLGFVALAPWLLALNATRTLHGTLASALLMSLALVAAVFAWFGAAIGAYTGYGSAGATVILLALAPLLQPQLLAFAVVRHLVGRHHGTLVQASAGAAAWVGCEWLLPKLLGDTLGHGLFPSATLRQVADLGGAAGLTLLLILVNEAVAAAFTRRRDGMRALLRPAALAVTLVVAMAGYGLLRLNTLGAAADATLPTLRVGLVQSNIIDYERLRAEIGAYAVVRHVLDTHYALSRQAIERDRVDALLWSETVFPTTFGHPKSDDGAALDREIQGFVDSAGVPLVFGTYDLDDAGEYNAAAFVEPGTGLLGYYRKTHPFPLTEHVPAWLDGPLLRRWLSWTGSWQPGHGARVMPLRSADGREVNVLPLICLDDVRSALAIDGARLGAQAIIGLSNDSWFSESPQGARLHLAVAAFRSIETRLPQLRVTTNGLSAVIDASGEVIASTAMGERTVLVGEIRAQDPPPTLMVRWGDWVGPAGLLGLLGLAMVSIVRRVRQRVIARRADAEASAGPAAYSEPVIVLSAAWRVAAAALRLCAGVGLLAVALRMLLRDGLQVNSLSQVGWFLAAVVAPALAAWALQRAFAARAHIEAGLLVLQQRGQRVEIPLAAIAALQVWRLPLPASGVDLLLTSGERWSQAIAVADPQALLQALNAAGSPARFAGTHAPALARYAHHRAASKRRWLDHPLLKFVLFPLLPALPAFRLHQHIAFGGSLGEYYTYGLQAWLTGLLIWWVSWAIGLMLFAAVLRVLIEAGCVIAQGASSARAAGVRHAMEWLGRLLFYAGVPTWLLLRITAG